MRARTPASSRVARRLGGVLLASVTVVAGLGLSAPTASAAPRPAATKLSGLISYASPVDGVDQVFTMNPDGSNKTQVTFNETGTKKCDPMLNNAGTEVTYAANDGRMYVHRLDDTPSLDDVQNIAPDVDAGKRGGGRRPSFSVDGQTIVFHFSVDTGAGAAVYDLWMTNRQPDGTWPKARRITQLQEGQWALHPRYSLVSGSTWLAYSFRESAASAYQLRVAQVPSDTEEVTGQTEPLGVPVASASSGALLATWSANGDKLAYVTSCASSIEYVSVTYNDASQSAIRSFGSPVKVGSSGGCGLSWSRTENNHLVYADYQRIYVKDVTSTRKATSLGSGIMPSW